MIVPNSETADMSVYVYSDGSLRLAGNTYTKHFLLGDVSLNLSKAKYYTLRCIFDKDSTNRQRFSGAEYNYDTSPELSFDDYFKKGDTVFAHISVDSGAASRVKSLNCEHLSYMLKTVNIISKRSICKTEDYIEYPAVEIQGLDYYMEFLKLVPISDFYTYSSMHKISFDYIRQAQVKTRIPWKTKAVEETVKGHIYLLCTKDSRSLIDTCIDGHPKDYIIISYDTDNREELLFTYLQSGAAIFEQLLLMKSLVPESVLSIHLDHCIDILSNLFGVLNTLHTEKRKSAVISSHNCIENIYLSCCTLFQSAYQTDRIKCRELLGYGTDNESCNSTPTDYFDKLSAISQLYAQLGDKSQIDRNYRDKITSTTPQISGWGFRKRIRCILNFIK